MSLTPKDHEVLRKALLLIETEYELVTEKRETARASLLRLEDQQSNLNRAAYGLRKVTNAPKREEDC